MNQFPCLSKQTKITFTATICVGNLLVCVSHSWMAPHYVAGILTCMPLHTASVQSVEACEHYDTRYVTMQYKYITFSSVNITNICADQFLRPGEQQPGGLLATHLVCHALSELP